MRGETRRERYFRKLNNVIPIPVSFATIYFRCDENLAFLIRTAACFGIRDIHVIGSIPSRKDIYSASGSLSDYIQLYQYSNPSEFIAYSRTENIKLISAEIKDNSTSLYKYKFNFSEKSIIVLGNETAGVPVEIAVNSDIVHVPMLGPGYCLNTSQTGTAFVTEYTRQYLDGKISEKKL